MSERARSTTSDGPRSAWGQIRALLLREHALGLVVYVCSVPERAGNALLGLTLLICAVLWSFWQGVIPRAGPHRRSIAVIEGVLLYVGAVTVANLLHLVLGQQATGW